MTELKDRLPCGLSGAARVEAALNGAAAEASIADFSLLALEVHSVDRSIFRLPGQPEAPWRGRVQHAFSAARKAGSRAGLC